MVRDASNSRPLPLTELLAIAFGGGLLFALWRFSLLASGWHAFDRPLLVGIAVGFLVWGGRSLLPARERPVRRAGRERRLSWIGAGLTAVGVELLLTMSFRAAQGIPEPVTLVVGLVMVYFGCRRLFHGLFPVLYADRPGYRVRILLPGLAYLLIMVVLFVGSLLGRSNMLMLVFTFMVGPFIVNGWTTFMMLRRIDVQRRLPDVAFAGEPFSVDLKFSNRKVVFSASLMVVTDCITGPDERLSARVLFGRIPPRQTSSAGYRLRLMRRGRYRFGPIEVSSRFPLGLVERGKTFRSDDDILVYPRIGRLTQAWHRDRSATAELVARPVPQRGTFYDEFHGIREYRHGDNPRAIHWRTSARRNELMIREFDQTRGRDLLLLVDLWSPGAPSDEDRERVELAVSFAATACVAHLRQTQAANLTVVAAGGECLRWEGRTGGGPVDSLLEQLALLEASASPDVAQLAREAAAHRSALVRTVLVTTRPRMDELHTLLERAARQTEGRISPVEYLRADAQVLEPLFALS